MAITPLEPSPNPFDGDFDAVADNFLSVGLPRLRLEINATAEHMEELEESAVAAAGAAAGSATGVAAMATAAANSATLADTRAAAAQTARLAAETARDLAQTYGAALSGTSVTSLLIEPGNKVFVTQAGKAWTLGQRLRAASDDGSKLMEGEVTGYAATNLTLLVDFTEGTGTHADWNIALAGARGQEGPPGAGSGTVTSVNGYTPDMAGAVVIPNATPTEAGLLSAADKAALDGKIDSTLLDTDVTLAANSDTKIATQKAVKAFAESLVVGLWDDRGAHNASGNAYPSSGGSGTAGAVVKGDIWTISVGGTLSGGVVEPGDTVRALVNSPGGTAGNWAIAQNNVGYVPLNAASNLSDLANASTARTNLGLVIGTNVQAYDVDTAKLDVAQSWTAQQTFKELKDTVHTITDGAAFEIDPANGSVQTVTLGANRTPTATNFEAGQTVLLGIDDGAAYTVTWSTVNPTWVKPGGTASAPTLAATGHTWILLWKVGSTVYGSEVGKP